MAIQEAIISYFNSNSEKRVEGDMEGRALRKNKVFDVNIVRKLP